MNNINNESPGDAFNDAVQYMEFFGDPKADFNQNKHISDDRTKIPYQLAINWNKLVSDKLNHSVFNDVDSIIWDDGNGHHVKPLSWLLMDVTLSSDFDQVKAAIQAQLDAKKAAELKSANDAAQFQLLKDLSAKVTGQKSTYSAIDNKQIYLIAGGIAVTAILITLLIKL